MDNIYSHLGRIQATLKAPKGQYNSFAKYNYRSCEDILAAFKEVADGCSVLLSDEISVFNDRVYVVATAILCHPDCDKTVKVQAMAREPLSKKGSGESQITGAASSYARKYALNGLFAIDDTKDADSEKPSQQQKQAAPKPKKDAFYDGLISDAQRKRMFAIANECKVPTEALKVIVEEFGFSSSKDITLDKYEAIIEKVKIWEIPY